MIKCQYQGCEKEATITLPVTVGRNGEHAELHLCEEHYHRVIEPEHVSYEFVKKKDYDKFKSEQ